MKGRPDLSIQADSGTPLDYAIFFKKREAVELLKCLNAPRAKEQCASTSLDETKLQTSPNSEPVPVNFTFFTLKSEEEDQSLHKELLESQPGLLKAFGWEASPAHARILKYCATAPLSLLRIPYFVRGMFNKPPAELSDGPLLLGESYLSAVERFVQLGYLRQLSLEEIVRMQADIKTLKGIASQHSIRFKGKRRQELINEALDRLPISAFVKDFSHFTFFKTTELGTEKLESVLSNYSVVENCLINRIVEVLIEPHLGWAARLAQDLRTVSLPHHRRHVLPSSIAKARHILSNEIPDYVNLLKDSETKLRAIAATDALYDNYEHRLAWSDFGIAPPSQIDGKILDVRDFARCLIVLTPEEDEEEEG